MDDHGTGAMRQRRPEPSWPTVIATTMRLWVQRHGAVRRWTVRTRRVGLAVTAGAIVVVATVAVVHRSPAPAAAPSRGNAVGSQAGTAPLAGAALVSATAARDQAAAWVAGQVNSDAIVACDPVMCAALQARGLPASRLEVLRTAAADPLGSDVVIATAAVRSQFGARLESVYAPLMIASFGAGAGRIDIRAIAPDGAPLTIPAIGVRTPLIRLRLTATGALQVPPTATIAGWYTGSPRPGAVGSAVIAGHIDSYRGPGVFFLLSRLRPGDRLYVRRADGTLAVFRVTSVLTYPKDRFPTGSVYGPTPDAELRLITCGGTFDPSLHSYLSNVVVNASESA